MKIISKEQYEKRLEDLRKVEDMLNDWLENLDLYENEADEAEKEEIRKSYRKSLLIVKQDMADVKRKIERLAKDLGDL